MFCEKCGSQLEEGVRFCTKCGHPTIQGISAGELTATGSNAPTETNASIGTIISTETNTSTQVKQEASKQEQLPTDSKKKFLKGILAGIIALIIILVAMIIFMMFLTKKKDTETTVQNRYEKSEKEEKDNQTVTEEESQSTQEETGQSESAQEEVQTTSETEQETNIDSSMYRTLAADEQTLADTILQMNSASYTAPTVDVYANNYVPGQRNYNATWDSKVFYQVEGIVNPTEYFSKYECSLTKRQSWTTANRNRIDYEVYRNPTTGKPNKIISLEYLTGGMEITEYYYTNEGMINFIFQYYTDNYVSSYATPSMPGARYLFHKDSLVTWRVIGQDTTINYVLGTAEAERMKNQFPASTMNYYNDFTDEMRRIFDETEKKMLNAAYNTYFYVMNAKGVALIQGAVNDADGNGMPNASVALFTEDFGAPLYTTATDSNGKYDIYVPNDAYNYNLKFKKEGYVDNDIYQITMSSEQIEASQDTVYLFTSDMGNADVALRLGDALNYAADGITMQALQYANIYVRRGMNNRIGEIISQAQSDSDGRVTLNLEPGMYTLEVAASGFENMFYNVIANPRRAQNFYELYATPDLEEGEVRIVLTWGEHPWDLDSHLFTTSGNSTDHIWYGDRNDIYGSNLDVDDTSSYGPETVTIPYFSNDTYYKYCVTDYTNCSAGNYNSIEMSYSDACVNVYSSRGLIATFHVPAMREGVIWEVFEIRRGEIVPIQRYYNTVTDKEWWSHE